MDWSDLAGSLAKLGVTFEPAGTLERLRELHALVVSANERSNLTRVLEEPAFIEKHVLDSLAGLTAPQDGCSEPESWIDVGAGAGLPGLAIAIARPRARV